MPESAALLARLRAHVGKAWLECNCDPARGTYCWQVRDIAERFYELRRDEVHAERLAARMEAIGA